MLAYQQQFIQFALENGALLFGDFTLKSGRKSPYFFNAGKFVNGTALAKLGNYYAEAIIENFSNQYGVLFGPAYKGIQLATAASIGLHNKNYLNVPVCYNRKEAKDHGEGGTLVGASLKDQRVLLVDDVITAGTTIRDSIQLIQAAGGKLIGVVIALDRQEKGLHSNLSTLQEVAKMYQLKVASIINLHDIIEFLHTTQKADAANYLKDIICYHEKYGIAL